MDIYEKEFNERKKIINSFKQDLKNLITKYDLKKESNCEYLSAEDDCNGVGTDVEYFTINGEKWLNENILEILDECI